MKFKFYISYVVELKKDVFLYLLCLDQIIISFKKGLVMFKLSRFNDNLNSI